MVAEVFKASRIVAFSTGCVYPFVPVDSGGATEDVAPVPPSGDYANSCVGRERMFAVFLRPARHARPSVPAELRHRHALRRAARRRPQGARRRADRPRHGPCQRDLAGRRQHRSRCAAWRTPRRRPRRSTSPDPETIEIRWLAAEFRQAFGQDAQAHRQGGADRLAQRCAPHGEGVRAARRAARQDDRMDRPTGSPATWPRSTSPRTTRCAMASTEALDVVPIDADQCEAVWPLSVEAGWNQNAADWRFMLGAGRGFGCTGPGRQMAGELAGPAARPDGSPGSAWCW